MVSGGFYLSTMTPLHISLTRLRCHPWSQPCVLLADPNGPLFYKGYYHMYVLNMLGGMQVLRHVG